MGYKIVYATNLNKKQPILKSKKYGRYICVIVIVLTFVLLSPVRYWIGKWLLPANIEKATEEFKEMISDIAEGHPVSDAFSSFCWDIIDDA